MFTKLTFNRVLLLIFGALIVLAIVLVFLLTAQGQRIRHAKVDTALVTQERHQKIVLSLGQPLDSISEQQIEFKPRADFSVLTNGATVVIQLKERLRYETKYEVTLSALRNVSGGLSKKNLTYSFETKPALFTYLKRNYESKDASVLFETSKGDDEIYQAKPNSQEDEVVFASSIIQEYCRAGKNLVIATLTNDDTVSLKILNLDSRQIRDVDMPEQNGALASLRCAPSGENFGYLFTSENDGRYKSTLVVSKTSDPSQKKTMNGVDGLVVRPREWSFAPDGTSIVTNDNNNSALLIDGTGAQRPSPLGQVYSLYNFTYDGRAIVAADRAGGLFLLDIPTFKKSAISNSNDTRSPANAFALSNSVGSIRRIAAVGSDALILETPDVEKEVYKSKRSDSILYNYGTSPNDQYLYATYAKDTSFTYDDYTHRPLPQDMSTIIIDLHSLKVVKEVDGFDLMWR